MQTPVLLSEILVLPKRKRLLMVINKVEVYVIDIFYYSTFVPKVVWYAEHWE